MFYKADEDDVEMVMECGLCRIKAESIAACFILFFFWLGFFLTLRTETVLSPVSQ
jgi:hypothetical protein